MPQYLEILFILKTLKKKINTWFFLFELTYPKVWRMNWMKNITKLRIVYEMLSEFLWITVWVHFSSLFCIVILVTWFKTFYVCVGPLKQVIIDAIIECYLIINVSCYRLDSVEQFSINTQWFEIVSCLFLYYFFYKMNRIRYDFS